MNPNPPPLPSVKKISKEKIAQMSEGTRAGLSRRLCAYSIGITEKTFYTWLRIGEEDSENEVDSLESEFFHEHNKAKADRAKNLLSIIKDAADSDVKHWTAAAWLLERGFKSDYSLRQEIINNHSGSIDTMGSEAIDERIKQILIDGQ